jgi:putative colanic acid biosynthesis acetyltransferase WcaF
MAYQELDTFKVPSFFRGRPAWFVQLWWIVDTIFFRTSPQFMYGWRRFLLRLFGAKIGKKVIIRPSAIITYPWNIEIGDFSWIGDYCTLYSLGKINIGKNSVVSQKCYVNTGSHDHNKKTFDIFTLPVTIEDECWITTDVYIAPGITIGKGTIVGARSSVFKSLPAGKICFGSPAKPIKDRT